ncbi:polysaccharide lyase 6 family protein [Colwellia sp. 1_MG-2023]|uniref:polysaccharide lyase 6 family protein n=1 Tax=Colwellia sp. 1_MG-2023 TaxID=3062649 RepID=UPI0026E38959|nr:polysaccharide lyase 6 family protein [Colwellia sp. 1_MG-2023]MDO6444473.1 polysaccharide lyase 6 family protein [Colwellia sp. 1_MG-2023]
MYKSKLFQSLFLSSLFLLVTAACQQTTAKTWLVTTQAEYKTALDKVSAGDEIVLSDGTWENFEILFKAEGTEHEPITLKAQTNGKVFLTGQSNLRLAGKHLIVSGLVFKDGYTPSSAVIEFRQNKNNLAYHSRVTEVVIEDYSNPDKAEGDYWVSLYGKHNRFDHSYLAGKRNKGVTMAVRLNTEDSQENYHQIDHNYFGPRPILGSNGGETLRIGTSHYSLSNSFTKVENNYFDRCNGEVEIISVKSGKNQLLNNTFFESRGTLTLRHGNGNVIENNVFFGNGVDHTGGIRVINKDQIIRNNYMEGLTGYRFGSGFTVMNGVPNSPINRYHQVENALIENNSMVNVDHIQLAAGSDAERSAAPLNSKLQNNLIFNENGKQPFTLFDDVSGIAFNGNVTNSEPLAEIASGFQVKELTLERAENGLLYPVGESIGADKTIQPIAKSATGPSWYAKNVEETAFDSGKEIHVNGNGDDLFDAVVAAEDGDVIVLAKGKYNVRKMLSVAKTLTVKAVNNSDAVITFERGTLFEIADGGSLKVENLMIDGVNSPDSAGNTLVRTQKWGMTQNYRFVMLNNVVKNLDINHSFHLFESGKGAFANLIEFKGNTFTNITGDLLRLDKEIEDLGIYNAEYVALADNKFENVSGALVKLYRGGTDESTFGPHLTMSNNQLTAIGEGKRNKTKASLFLHGVQVTNINNNNIANSAPIKVEHTVGEPKTSIANNQLSQAVSVVELRVEGPHTAELSDNTIVNK